MVNMKAQRIMGYRQANRMHLGEVAAVKLLIYHHYRSTSTLTHGRYLSEVRYTLYTTHPTMRLLSWGLPQHITSGDTNQKRSYAGSPSHSRVGRPYVPNGYNPSLRLEREVRGTPVEGG